MRTPTDIEKLEIMRNRINIAQNMIIDGYVNINWAIKNILGFDKKSEYRMFKIKRIFNV